MSWIISRPSVVTITDSYPTSVVPHWGVPLTNQQRVVIRVGLRELLRLSQWSMVTERKSRPQRRQLIGTVAGSPHDAQADCSAGAVGTRWRIYHDTVVIDVSHVWLMNHSISCWYHVERWFPIGCINHGPLLRFFMAIFSLVLHWNAVSSGSSGACGRGRRGIPGAHDLWDSRSNRKC